MLPLYCCPPSDAKDYVEPNQSTADSLASFIKRAYAQFGGTCTNTMMVLNGETA